MIHDMAGEVRDPQRTLPRALTLGLAGVALCYVLANLAYLVGLGHAGLAASKTPMADRMQHISGRVARPLWPSASPVPRSVMRHRRGRRRARVANHGADGMLFRDVGRIDARWCAPQVALAVLGLWAIVLRESHITGYSWIRPPIQPQAYCRRNDKTAMFSLSVP